MNITTTTSIYQMVLNTPLLTLVGATVPVVAYLSVFGWVSPSVAMRQWRWGDINVNLRPATDSDDEAEEEVVEETSTRGGEVDILRLRRVRRAQGTNFVRKWVNWGKAEFPMAYKMEGAANRTIVSQRLAREMRRQSVRDADIARYLPRVVVGVLMPSVHEREAELYLTSNAAYLERESLIVPRSSWSRVFGLDRRINWGA